MIAVLALNAILSIAPCPRQLHLVPALALAEEQPAPQAQAARPRLRGGPRLLEVAAGAGAGVLADAAGFGMAYVAFSLAQMTGSFINAILGVGLATAVAAITLSAVPPIVTCIEAWVVGGDAPPFAFTAALGLASAVQLLAVVLTGASLLAALPLAYVGLAAGVLLSLVGVPVAASWGLHGFAAGAPTAEAAGRGPEALAPSLRVAALAF